MKGDDDICVWDTETGKLLAGFRDPVRGKVTSQAFSPGGRILAVATWATRDVDVYSIELLEIPSKQRIRSFSSPQGRINSLAFSADGRTLATGGADSTICLWDLTYPDLKLPAPLAKEDLDRLWTELKTDAATADEAIWKFARSPEFSLPFFKARLLAETKPEPAKVAQLVADLESDQFAVREKATRALFELGSGAERALRDALKTTAALETSRRLTQLLAKLDTARLAKEPEIVRQLRAVDAIEHMGTAEARRLLELVARDTPEQRVEVAATAANSRLASRPKTD